MSLGKRGQFLERLIETSNKMYENKGVALINKVPTPWNVMYDKRTRRVINAFPERKSTVDFAGISQGQSIAFEAKTTNVKTRFPLNNFEQHQVDYLMKHQEQGGASFSIIFFEVHNEHFFLTADDLHDWWSESKVGGRKSIPYEWFTLNCDMVRSRNGIALDFLEYINSSYKGQQ